MTANLPPSDPPYQALYLHIPFCKERCRYCDFTSEAISSNDRRIDAYLDNLSDTLDAANQKNLLEHIQTVYIGGGTPTHIGPDRLSRLINRIAANLPQPPVEFSVEANPESLTDAMIDMLQHSPVTRVSIGVQSFHDNELQALGRLHDSQTARRAISSTLQHFDNVSIDLMCGIPEQSATSLATSLQTAIDLQVPHVSVYPLTLEDDTPLSDDVQAGRVTVADDDSQADMLQATHDLLSANAYSHYEIASWARDGYQCRHNTAYWTAVPYLGLGHGAVGMCMQDGIRHRFSEDQTIESLNAAEQAAEDLMLRLRLLAGAPDALVAATARHLPAVDRCLLDLTAAGLLVHTGGFYRLSEQGWLLGNQAFASIWGLVD